MANLADTIVFGDLTVTRDQLVKGTLTVEGLLQLTGNVSIGNNLTVGGTVSGNGSGLTSLNASNLGSGTVPTARLPAAALIGNTTYAAGSGLSLSGTTFSVSSPFNPGGTYGSLRAQGTTKADVGLANVPNLDLRNASYLNSGTVAEARLPASALVGNTTYSAGAGLSLSGTTFSVSSPFSPSGNYASLRARATTKADVGLGNVSNTAASDSSTANTVALRSGSGDIIARLFRSEYDTTNSSIGFIMTQVDTASNNYLRPSTPAQLKTALGIVAGDVGGLGSAATQSISAIRSGTTKADVGLSNVPNWSQATFDGRFLGKTAKAADADKLDGIDSSGFARTTGTYGIRATGTTKEDVGLGTVRNVASYSQAESNGRYLRKNTSDTLTGNLTVTGEVSATDVVITSDLRVKSDLIKIPSALKGILSLTGYTYRMKGLDKNDRRMGLGAQDVLKVFPEAVHGTEESHYSLSYGSLVAALVEGIKEQQATINSLSERLDRLESR